MAEVKELCVRIDRVNRQLLEAKRNNSERTQKIIDNKRQLLDEISKIRKDINRQLDHLEEKATTDLNTTEAELQKELNSYFDILQNHIDNLDRVKASLDGENESARPKDAEELITEAKSFINNANKIAALSLKMTPNEDLVSSIINSTRLASFDFHLTEEPATPREKLEAKKYQEITVDGSARDHPRYISCICLLVDGNYIVADTNNNELIKMDIDFNETNTLALPDGPYGMCVIDLDEIAVRLCSKAIQIVQTRPSFSLKKSIYIGETPYSCGLAFCNGVYWSSGYRTVNMYSKDGTKERTIVNDVNRDVNGEKPFQKGHPEDIAISKDGTEVFVTDSKDGVLIFGRDGKFRMALRDERLKQTKGVAVTEDGLVIVAGFNSKNIIAFNPDSKTSNVIVSSKGMTGYPVSLLYDARLNRLLVGCNNSKLLVFEMKK